jgi:Leucine-rich repeat (LRR) protein
MPTFATFMYLANDTTGVATAQITRLIRDEATDNFSLVLEIIAGGGVNYRLMGYLFGAAVMHHDKAVAERAMVMLQKYATPETVKQATRLREASNYHYNESEYLGKYQNAEFDIFDFILAQKMCHWHRAGQNRSHYYISSHQKLDLTHYPHKHLTPGITTLDFVHFLTLPANKDFDLNAALEQLRQLPLESIYIESVRLDEFPILLLQLPKLRILSIKRGTYRPRHPMRVPEKGGPYGSKSLTGLFIESYQIEGEANLGPFPALTEVSCHRCNLHNLDFLIHSLALEHLSIRHNHLEHVPEFIGEFTKLKTLDLVGNPFKTIQIDLQKLPNLEHYDIKK